MSFRARRTNPWIGAPVAVAMAWLACAAVVHAEPEPAVVAQVLELNRKAVSDYDNLNFDEARAELREALAVCDRNNLGNHPVRARTYVTMGVVLLAADAAHRDVAIAHFRRAFQIQSDVQLPVRLANPEVAQAFAEAKRSMAVDEVAKQKQDANTNANAGAEVSGKADTGDAETAKPHVATTNVAADRAPDAQLKARPASGGTVAGPEGDEEEEESEGEGKGAGPRFIFSLGVGSGFGWVGSGAGEVNSDLKLPSGFDASSMIHVAPEVGYFVSSNLALSLQARLQFISGTTPERSPSATGCGGDGVCSPSKGATAVFAKATWYMGSGALRPFVSGALGVGQIRHVVSVPGHNDCGADAAHPVACVDTRAAGPFFFGPGGGALIELAPHVALTAGASALLGVSSFTFHLDFTGGVAVQL